jgi:hypothetical protein
VTRRLVPALALLAATFAAAREPGPGPSRKPDRGCAWARLSSPDLGLELFHEKCDYGFRTVDHVASAKAGTLYEVLKDAASHHESLEPVIVMYEMNEGETPEAAIQRLIFPSLKRKERARCLVARKKLGFLDSIGKRAYVIVPNQDYLDMLDKRNDGDMPEPPCGDRGESADGFAYFEFHPGETSRRFAYVDFGQEEHPLFDEKSLTFLP